MALSKINTRALANDSVTVDKVADNAVTTAMITDGTIGVTDLADGAITNAKVSSTAAIDASKLNLSGVTSAGITTLTGQDINLYNATDGDNALRFYDDDDLLSGGLYVWSSRLNIASYNSQDIALSPAGNVNITSGSLQVGGTTVIDSDRKFAHGTTIGSGATVPNDGGTLQLTRSNNNPYVGFYSNDGTRNGYIQSIGGGTMYIANEEGGGWTFHNGTDTSATISANGVLTTRKVVVTDDGASGSLVQIRADDSAPWGLVVGNDTVSADDLGGLNIYQNSTSYNAELWIRTPDRSGGFIFRTKGITSNTSTDDLLSLPADVSSTATFYRRPQVNHSSPYIILNDTDATDTNNMVGWLSFQRQGSERGYVGYGSATNDQLYLHNYDGNVVVSAANNSYAVNIANGKLQMGGNTLAYNTGNISSWNHYQTGTQTTPSSVTSNMLLKSAFEEGPVLHPFLMNDWANFVHRGGTVTYGGVSSSPSASNTDRLFTTGSFLQINGSTYTGSTMTITLTNPPKNFTYGAYAGITFNSAAWSPTSCKIETSTDGGSTWTTRLNNTAASAQYVTNFSSGGTQTNAIRFTLGLPNLNGASGSLRIQNIFAFNYSGNGMEEYFVPRGGGQMYGDLGIGTSPSAAYGPTMHIKGANPNLRLEGTGTGSWAYFELNNANYERSFGMATDGTFRITDQRGDMDNGIQLQLQQNGRFNVLESISAGTQTSALKGYFYENTADQNGSSKPTSVLGVAAYTNNNGEGPSIDFSSVWVGMSQYQQDNWNEGWVVGRIAGVYDNHVSNGGALVFHTHTGTSASGGAGNTSVAERFRIKPEGQLTVSGTTPIATQEGILRSGNIITGKGNNQTTPTMHGFGQIFVRNWGTGRYIHMKTDIPVGTTNGSFGMYCITAVGFIYGNAKTIDGIWGGHNWGTTIYSKAHTNNGSQAFVYNQYKSSDNYLVLVADVGTASDNMYAGWTMDFHYTNTTYTAHSGKTFDAHTVTAHSLSSSTSGVY